MAANTASNILPSPTDVNSNVISVGPSVASAVDTETRMTIVDFSDGFSQRIPDGPDNLRRIYTVVHENLNTADADLLREWYEFYSKGQTIQAPTAPTDNTTRNYYIREFNEQRSGPLLHTFTAVLVEDK
jgi:phage-related protein